MEKTKIKFIDILKKHVLQNYKEYIIIMIFFIIGIFSGVFFINQIEEEQKSEIYQYLQTFIDNVKNIDSINQMEVLKISIYDKIWLTIAIWFFGTTIIGLPIVFGLVIYRGFCLGYTIATSISLMGFTKGLQFICILLVLHNIIFIPALIGLAVSGFKFYKSIIKDRRKENIKIEFVRHTIFSALMLLIMIGTSLIEVFISTNVLKNLIQYF